MIHRSNSDGIKEKYKTKTINFQGQSSRSKHWFDFDHWWLKESFMTRETKFYKKPYQNKFWGDTTHDYQKFVVPIGNAIMNKKVWFCTEAPLIKYHQNSSNNCCLSSF